MNLKVCSLLLYMRYMLTTKFHLANKPDHPNRSAKKTLYAIRRKKREGLIEYLKRLFNSKKNDGK